MSDPIRWRVNLRSNPEQVYDTLATDEGRARFWAEKTEESSGTIRFQFHNGMSFEGKVFERRRPERFAVEYFGGSTVLFQMEDDGAGGTDLTMTESGFPEANRMIHLPGWIPVLLGLKAAVDFSVDLRNGDPSRSWEAGFVDV